jgi:potassium-dependent mechanosensitive channel
MKILKSTGILFAVFVLFLSFNATALAAKKPIKPFDIKDVYTKLDVIKERLEAPNLQVPEAKNLAVRLVTLREDAQHCVERAEGRLKSVDKLFESIHVLSDQNAVKKSEEYKYLQERKDIAAQKASDCRLFLFKSKEVLDKAKRTERKLNVGVLLKRSSTIGMIFKKGIHLPFKDMDLDRLYQLSGIDVFVPMHLFLLLFAVLIALIVAIFIRIKCKRWLKKQKEYQKVSVAFVSTIKAYIVPLLILGVVSGVLLIIFSKLQPKASAALVGYYLFGYVALLALLSFVLSPPKPAIAPFYKLPETGRVLFKRLVFLSALLLIGALTVVIFRAQPRGLAAINFVKTFYFVLLSVVVVWTCWLFARLPLLRDSKKISMAIKIILILFLLFVVTAQLSGYHQLTVYLISKLLLTFVATCLLWIIVNIVRHAERFFNVDDHSSAQKLRCALGIKSGKKITELFYIKVSILLVAVYLFVVAILLTWGVSLITITKLDDAMMDGFSFASLTIIPSRIIIALLVFGILMLVGKWISTYIAAHRKFSGEKDVQVTMDSIIGYMMFALALILSLLVAGVNFTGLAVIAGALSVGVGLGLQVIVNNFVSGIILLLDKNINPGDLIVVNGVEGIIKKISLRSTQLTTLSSENIIVPNTELFANKVINYTLHGKVGQVICKVGVVQGSDIDLVEKILIEVAKKQPDVLQDETNQPKVMFSEFTSGSLKFSLLLIVPDVRKKNKIISKLNIAIEQALEKHKIEVSFISG